MYNLPEGYTHRDVPGHHDDRSFTDGYQDYVYKRAREILEGYGLSRVIDIGCGSGFKLIKYFADVETVGLELEPALSFLKEKYPDKIWRESNFEAPQSEYYDIAICSDVIEHIPNPDELLEFLSKIRCDFLIISTPNRDQLKIRDNGVGYNGPPRNPCHCREWTKEELSEYVGNTFDIIQYIENKDECSQALVCRGVVR